MKSALFDRLLLAGLIVLIIILIAALFFPPRKTIVDSNADVSVNYGPSLTVAGAVAAAKVISVPRLSSVPESN